MKASKHQVLAKIEFLEIQLTDLNHYHPETYEYLLVQLNQRIPLLAKLNVEDTYAFIDLNKPTCTHHDAYETYPYNLFYSKKFLITSCASRAIKRPASTMANSTNFF